MLVGSYGLSYFTEIRYWVSKNRKRFATADLHRDYKPKTLEEIYQEEIAGKKFDDWENIRAPRPWEPETIRANEEKARQLRQQRLRERLNKIEERALESKDKEDSKLLP